jgi:hypothetical protein
MVNVRARHRLFSSISSDPVLSNSPEPKRGCESLVLTAVCTLATRTHIHSPRSTILTNKRLSRTLSQRSGIGFSGLQRPNALRKHLLDALVLG